jgi:hypothetical protein
MTDVYPDNFDDFDPSSPVWCTAADVLNFTGQTVTDDQALQGQALIELVQGFVGGLPDDVWVSPRDLEWLKRASAYETVWMLAQPDLFSRMDFVALAQDGESSTLRDSALYLAPLARMAIKRLSWKGTRSITVRGQDEVKAGYRENAYDDNALPWGDISEDSPHTSSQAWKSM